MLNRFENLRVETVKLAVAAIAGATALVGCGLPSDDMVEKYNEVYQTTYDDCVKEVTKDMVNAGASDQLIDGFIEETCLPDAEAAARLAINNT